MALSGPKYRHELKYLINYGEKEILAARLKEIADIDPHATAAGYTIRSLYFDDLWDSSYEEKLMGTASRKKYRIRLYNFSDDFIVLECKEKEGSYIYKRSLKINREITEDIINGRYQSLDGYKDELAMEFQQLLKAGMHPAVVVDYDRLPFVYDPGTVRITFDMHLRAAFTGNDIFDPGLPVFEAMEDPDKLIMEVKYTEFLPELFKEVLTPHTAVCVSSSKYVICNDIKRQMYGLEIIR